MNILTSKSRCKGDDKMKLCDMCLNKDRTDIDPTKLSMERKISNSLCKITNASFYKSKARKVN